MVLFLGWLGGLPVSAEFPAQGETWSSYTIQIYRIEHGLPSSLVTALHQDERGLIWIGTYGGLERFDGLGFKSFNRHVNPAMRSHNISAIAGGPGGSLWVSAAGGDLYRLEAEMVAWFPAAADLPHPEIQALAIGAEGDIWVGSFGGLCRIRGPEVRCFDDADGLPPDFEAGEGTPPTVQALEFDDSGRLWVATLAGLARLEGERFELAELAPGERPSALHLGADGRLWAGTDHGRIGRLGGAGFEPVLELGADVRVSGLAPTEDGGLWVGTFTHGLGRWEGGRVRWLDRSSGLPSNNVQSLLVDREGVIWAGTTRGLVRLADTAIAQLGERQGMSGSIVVGMSEGRDDLWVVTAEGGLNRLVGERFEPADPWAGEGQPKTPRLVNEDETGDVWIGTRPDGLYRWRPGELPRAERAFDDIRVSDVLRTRAGELWVATWNHGLYRGAASGWTRFGTAEGLPSPGIFTLLEAVDGTLWIGTRLGPAHMVDGAITSHEAELGLSDPAIVSLYEDAAGGVWMGTISAGLLHFDGDAFTVLSEAQGLQDNSVWAMLEDDHQQIWISSTIGISRVPKAELEAVVDGTRESVNVIEFGPSDGLVIPAGIGGFSSAGLRLRDGTLAFATMAGVAFVGDPGRSDQVPPPPRPFVVGAVIDDLRFSIEDGLVVPPGARRTTLEVAAPTMVGVEQVEVRARLAGTERWDELGQAREISYTNLKPGRATLELQSSRDGRRWSGATRFPIRVEPRWDQTWLFRGLLALVFLASGPAFYRVRMARVKQRELELERLVEERTEELRVTNLRLEHLSTTDALTGLANRRRFDAALDREWRRATRAKEPVSVLFVDADRFKFYNDDFGHAAGDDCLRELARVIEDHARRAGDVAARYGGEEFCVLVPGAPVEVAWALGEGVRRSVEELGRPHPRSPGGNVVTVSVGVATVRPESGDSPDVLLRAADKALYAAKKQGCNRVIVYPRQE